MVPHNNNTRGFTLLELLVTIGVAAVLLAGTSILLRPNDHAAERRNAQRWVGAAELVQLITNYRAHTGTFPPGVTAKQQVIGSLTSNGDVDICANLVPAYANNLPFDPSIGAEVVTDASVKVDNCTSVGADYSTGYSISISKTNLLTVVAPAAEQGQHISITRQY